MGYEITKENKMEIWDGMTVDEVVDFMDSINVQISHDELWDGMTKVEVIDAIAIAKIGQA
tara:strand:+ start:256 stop:435 length:180 start_codon:yes stop_codon:yes gene_type:complete